MFTDPMGLNPAVGCLAGSWAGPLGCGVGAGVGILGGIALAAMMSTPGETQKTDQCPPAPGGKDPCKGLRDQVQDHERKLREYMGNPMSMDNKGFLAGALASRPGEHRRGELHCAVHRTAGRAVAPGWCARGASHRQPVGRLQQPCRARDADAPLRRAVPPLRHACQPLQPRPVEPCGPSGVSPTACLRRAPELRPPAATCGGRPSLGAVPARW